MTEPNQPRLPIHFLTIVLNGEPFIRHHIAVLEQLEGPWHWHVVEGVASLVKDTGWSVQAGGYVPADLHRDGLSVDGTTEYLDAMAAAHPGRVTLYRPPPGRVWAGKIDMVTAPMAAIGGDCLLWQLDSDELWSVEQVRSVRALFEACPERTAAYFLAAFFVGPDRIATTLDAYGNRRFHEWLRVWRCRDGDRWVTHEPPVLGRPMSDGSVRNIAEIAPFTQDETASHGLVMQHFAYATAAQLRFKEAYYGYRGAVARWQQLQAATEQPLLVRRYLPWVEGDAVADRAAARGLVPLARLGPDGAWRFQPNLPPHGPRFDPPFPIDRPTPIFRAVDINRLESALPLPAIASLAVIHLGEPAELLLASGFLRGLRRRFPGARITLIAPQPAERFYGEHPDVDEVATLPPAATLDGPRLQALTHEVHRAMAGRFDLVLCPGPPDPWGGAGLLAVATLAPWRIAFAEPTTPGALSPNRCFTHLMHGLLPDRLGGRYEAALWPLVGSEIRSPPVLWVAPPAAAEVRQLRAALAPDASGGLVVIEAALGSATVELARSALAANQAPVFIGPDADTRAAASGPAAALPDPAPGLLAALVTAADQVAATDPVLCAMAAIAGVPVLQPVTAG